MIEDGAIERTDRFSFSQPGAEFLAWEWLSAVILGALHNWAGLKGVVLFSAVLVSLTVFVVLFQMTVLRANALAAVVRHSCLHRRVIDPLPGAAPLVHLFLPRALRSAALPGPKKARLASLATASLDRPVGESPCGCHCAALSPSPFLRRATRRKPCSCAWEKRTASFT